MSRGLIGFFVGTLLFEFWLEKREISDKYNYILAIALLGVYVITRLYGYEWLGDVQMLFLLFIAPLVLWLSIQCSIVRKILEIRPLVFLGKCSLHIYMWHFPIQYIIKIIDISTNMHINYSTHRMWLIYVFITLVVAIISYSVFDRWRIIKVK